MSNIYESMTSRLAQLTGADIPADERDEWEGPHNDTLSIDHRYVTDIVLAVGGPTQMFCVHHDLYGDVWRVEYCDSWGAEIGREASITLNEEEEETLLNAIGWYDLELWRK